MGGRWIEIGEADSVENLAFRYGLLPETVWDHPENADLRAERDSMHVLRPGDRLFVPAIEPKAEDRAIDATHRFRRRGVPSKLVVTLVIGGEPLADRPCRLELGGRDPEELRTDADGRVEVPVMPHVGAGRLVVETHDGAWLEIPLAPRALDPVDTPSGAQARLRNLGYLPSEPSGTLDLATVLALARFQEAHGLPKDGRLDEATQAALVDAHGS